MLEIGGAPFIGVSVQHRQILLTRRRRSLTAAPIVEVNRPADLRTLHAVDLDHLASPRRRVEVEVNGAAGRTRSVTPVRKLTHAGRRNLFLTGT